MIPKIEDYWTTKRTS